MFIESHILGNSPFLRTLPHHPLTSTHTHSLTASQALHPLTDDMAASKESNDVLSDDTRRAKANDKGSDRDASGKVKKKLRNFGQSKTARGGLTTDACWI